MFPRPPPACYTRPQNRLANFNHIANAPRPFIIVLLLIIERSNNCFFGALWRLSVTLRQYSCMSRLYQAHAQLPPSTSLRRLIWQSQRECCKPATAEYFSALCALTKQGLYIRSLFRRSKPPIFLTVYSATVEFSAGVEDEAHQ